MVLVMLLASRLPALHASGECTPALVSSLVRERPGVVVVTEGAVEPEDLSLSLARLGERWRLEVRGDDGAIRLERELSAADCGELADAAAAVVERYLVSISWRAGEPPTPDVPRPEHRLESPPPETHPLELEGHPPESRRSDGGGASELASPEPADAGVLLASTTAVVPAPPSGEVVAAADAGSASLSWVGGPEVSVGPAVMLGVSAAVPAAAVEVSVRIRQALRASLWAGASLPEAQPVTFGADTRGQVRLQFDFAYASVSGCRSFGRLEACGGGAAGLAVAYASVNGRLYDKTDGWLAPLALGAVGRVSYGWPSGAEVGLQALAGLPLSRPAFTVDSHPPVQYVVPPAELVCALHLGWAFR